MSRPKSPSRGDSLIEIIIVTFVIATMLVALVSLTTLSVARNRLATQRTVANRLGQEGLEWLRSQRDLVGYDDFATTINLANDPATPYVCINDLEDDDSGMSFGELSDYAEAQYASCENINSLYKRWMSDIGINEETNTVTATIYVSWPGQKSDEEQITLTGEFSKWEK